MRDKVLAYALAISVGVHVIILCVVGRTSAAQPIEVDELKLVRVNVVKLPDEPKPVPEEVVKPAPEHMSIPPPEKIPVAPPPKPRPRATPPREAQAKKPSPAPSVKSPVYSSSPDQTNTTKPPGDPGGPVDLGSSSTGGQDLGPSGQTPVGWVPGSPDGTGTGSGKGPGTGQPEPVPGAVEGPGTEPAPPPPPPDVVVKVCAESGMRPGPNCERTVVRSFRPGKEPTAVCTICKPKHVSTLADRSTPELVSGRKRPAYPAVARDKGIEGSVTVEYTINTEGKVVGVKVVSSSGSSLLDQAAVDTVRNRKYKPAVQAGIPRNYRKRETFHFTLN